MEPRPDGSSSAVPAVMIARGVGPWPTLWLHARASRYPQR